MVDRPGRTVLPALPAQFTQIIITGGPLYKMLPDKAMKSRGSKDKGRYIGKPEVPDRGKIPINLNVTGDHPLLSRDPVCEQIIRVHAWNGGLNNKRVVVFY